LGKKAVGPNFLMGAQLTVASYAAFGLLCGAIDRICAVMRM